jgi:putative ABC transport system permease protein
MSGLIADLRLALRQLLRSPGFTALAVLTLTLAIGANTAMFTVAEDVLLRPLAYRDADRLVAINPSVDDRVTSTSWLNYRDIRDQTTHSFTHVAVYSEDVGVVQASATATSASGGAAAPVSTVTPNVSPDVFPMLGISPLLGRSFTEQEGQSNGPSVALLSKESGATSSTQIRPSSVRPSG